jgi:Transposase
MEHYVGLDVSLKLTAICIVDRTGKIEREGVVASDPETIAAFIKSHAPHVARVGLETGATSTWLWTELNKMGLPAICIDARHAKAALKLQINKSDRNDAVGIARIMQCGWYKEVRVKDFDSHAIKALLVSRAAVVVSVLPYLPYQPCLAGSRVPKRPIAKVVRQHTSKRPPAPRPMCKVFELLGGQRSTSNAHTAARCTKSQRASRISTARGNDRFRWAI